jgi:hypothetical protein
MFAFLPRSISLLASTILLAGNVSAQSGKQWIEAQEAKIEASTPSASALFGRSVAKYGDLAVIGAPLDDNSSGSDAGAAYIFRLVVNTWTEVAEILGSAGSSTDLFGESVAVSGNTVVAGAYLDDPGNLNAAGSAYVFTECSGLWTEIAQLLDPFPAVGDHFGSRVAIDGERIVVGCNLDDSCAVDAGSAFVFARHDPGTPANPCDDSWILEAQLLPSNCQVGQGFGASVAIQGDRIAVGAPLDDTPEQDRGSVTIFERVGTAWFQREKLTAPDGVAMDGFGNSIALSGDTILIGASLDDSPEVDRGSAYVFRLIAGAWGLEQQLTGSGGAAADLFGFSVDVDGDLAIVSSLDSNDAGASTGSLCLFRRTNSVWTEAQHVTSGDAAAGDEFGAGLALDGTTMLIGAQRDDDAFNSSGSAYAFTLSSGNFTRFGFGDGSGTACPCGNFSHPRLAQGCVNSSGWGGKLSIAGSDSAAQDDFRLLADNLLPGKPALMFHGPTMVNGGAGLVFGNGLRLVGGQIKRGGVFVPDSLGRAAWGPGLGSGFPWVSGSTRHFQVWYRDPAGYSCGDVFNLTNAVTVTFQN